MSPFIPQAYAAIDLGQTFFGNHPVANYSQEPVTALLSAILPNVFIIAGLILFIYLIAGGFLIISAGGQTKNLEQGKTMITQALVGFFIVFLSYWIIQIIEVVTGIPILHANL